VNILFIWTGVTGYMGDAWRVLSRMEGVCLKVLVQERELGETRFDHAVVLRELDATVVTGDSLAWELIDDDVRQFHPDVIFLVGWRRTLPRHIALSPCFNGVPKILIFDLPFAWTLKKLLAPVVLRAYLKRFDACFVPNAAVRYARWLGFDGGGLGKIETNLFCANVSKFDDIARKRSEMAVYPRRFLFVGRYVREKGIDVLVSAYKQYREWVKAQKGCGISDCAWDLTCCGMGPLKALLEGVEGVRDIGFVQPDELPELFLNHGAFVIASSHEPWGVVLVEAAAAGLPIVCTEACGAAQDVVSKNGFVCKMGDREGIARALCAIHSMEDGIRRKMGEAGVALAAEHSCEAWATHVVDMSQGRVFAGESSSRYQEGGVR
jgi:glycosyltransferase involved in cell wall biosynthesis